MKKLELINLIKECIEEISSEGNAPEVKPFTREGNLMYIKMLDIANLSDPSYNSIVRLKKEIESRVKDARDFEQLRAYFNFEFGHDLEQTNRVRAKFNEPPLKDAWEYFNKLDETVNESNKDDYETQLKKAYTKARREKNVEAMAYYYEIINSNTSANVSFERFKGSWAYDQWLKKPKTQEIISKIQEEFKRFSYMNEQLSIEQVDNIHKAFLDSKVENISMANNDTTVNIKLVNGTVIQFKSNSPIEVKNLGALN